MSQNDLQIVRQISASTGLTTDYVCLLCEGLSIQALYKLAGNAAALPSTMKSIDSRYVRRSFKAPPIEG